MLEGNAKRFKSIPGTYKIITLLFTMGLMYPNPKYDEKRKKLILFVILSVIPALVLTGNDMRIRILNNDMPNLVRQSIVTVAMIFILLKLIITTIRKKEFRDLFDNIDDDYELFNDMPEEYQNIVEESIKMTKKFEKVWFTVMCITAFSYPVLAGACTMYSQIVSENPKLFMVHEVAIVFLTEEQKYESPYFELVNIYIIYVVIVIFIVFMGFDGIFSVCMLHITLKLKINNKKLQNLFNNVVDIQEIKANIATFVNNHCEAERLVGEVQKCFEAWLVAIFLYAILQLGMSLTQLTNQTKETDINPVYYLFALATLFHIYIPCYLASEVTSNAAEIANAAYCCSWEQVPDVGIRKSICIIIAKAQTPICLNALGMLTFNMEMFLSIVQTAYSMYTLFRK